MIDELNEARLRKNGKISPKVIAENLSEWVNDGVIETVIITVKTTDGEVLTSYSAADNLEYVGLIEMAKMQLIEENF